MNIGGAVVRRLLTDSEVLVFNLDKMGYASDLPSIEALPEAAERHQLLQVDLTDAGSTADAVRQADFRFDHISTDEVFGSLGPTGRFSETTPCDHLVNAWHHTYSSWQFPEKPIPLYGDGQNVRDWLYVDDHVDALFQAACQGAPRRACCVGGSGSNGTASERTNKEVVEAICRALDGLLPISPRIGLSIRHRIMVNALRCCASHLRHPLRFWC